MDDLSKLLTHGLIGTYTHFEATEIFVSRGEGVPPDNVLTILVAEDRGDDACEPIHYLDKRRIKVAELDDWSFGIKRYTRPITDLILEIEKLEKNGAWEGAGEPLQFGSLHKMPAQFVPPNSTTIVPWNRVLKNNFWNGSHVIEWSDREKRALATMLDAPLLVQDLALKVAAQLPIDLAGLSDRVGNFVIQLPVISLMAKFEPRRTGACGVKVAWRPGVKPRPLRATCHFEFDGTIGGFASGPISEPETLFLAENARGLHHGFLWDDESNVVLAAAGPTGFIESISMNTAVVGGEPRTFCYTDAEGNVQDHQVGMSSIGTTSVIGRTDGDETGGRTRRRIFQEQEDALKEEKIFVQYDPESKGVEAERKRALDDVRILINRHGLIGAWLWDPYLNAYDILETLFWSRQSGSDLRALTAAKVPPNFVETQRKTLHSVDSNWLGFRLEFRVRRGQFGWDFHDRFLIFPQKGATALAWSLGTSINGLGRAHHIFQKVGEGQLVMNAFEKLWDKLIEPDHLIWKKP